jgi:hypothetical protein
MKGENMFFIDREKNSFAVFASLTGITFVCHNPKSIPPILTCLKFMH